MPETEGKTHKGRYRIGDLTLDTGALRVERSGRVLSLPKLSFRMLECLVRRSPDAVSFDQLMDEVWDGIVVNQETITQRARLLRESIGDDSRHPKIIETVRGYGYRLIPNVESLAEVETPRTPRWRLAVGALVAGLVIVALLNLPLVDKTKPNAAAPSIAILPIVNMSSDAEQEYLADGLTVELTSLLTRVPDLRVAAYTSAFSFKGSDARIDDIADSLNVSHVLEGSVRKSGDEIRITVQLIEAGTGFNAWSQTYERQMASVFDLQDEIAAAIVQALRPALGSATPTVAKTDTRAYAHYLRARHFDNLKGRENWRLAVEHYKLALGIDPEFAAAWAGLSVTYYYMANRGVDLATGMELARDAAQRALSLDPDQADALATLSLVMSAYDWNYTGAIAAIQKALALEPGNSNVLNRAGSLAFVLGQSNDAIAFYKQAIATDPLNMSPRNSLAIVYMNSGQFALARLTLAELDDLNPDYPWGKTNLARTLLLQGDAAEAREVAGQVADFWHDPLMIMADYTLGQRVQSDQRLDKFAREHAEDAPTNLAEIHAWRGEVDAAFRYLGRAIEMRDPALIYIADNPFMAKLRSDTRWQSVLHRIGLLEPPQPAWPTAESAETTG